MAAFTPIPHASVVLSKDGVYKEHPLREDDGVLFAETNAGYVRLHTDGRTSAAKVRIHKFIGIAPFADPLGRLLVSAPLETI